jgi:hypothetical protein
MLGSAKTDLGLGLLVGVLLQDGEVATLVGELAANARACACALRRARLEGGKEEEVALFAACAGK